MIIPEVGRKSQMKDFIPGKKGRSFGTDRVRKTMPNLTQGTFSILLQNWSGHRHFHWNKPLFQITA